MRQVLFINNSKIGIDSILLLLLSIIIVLVTVCVGGAHIYECSYTCRGQRSTSCTSQSQFLLYFLRGGLFLHLKHIDWLQAGRDFQAASCLCPYSVGISGILLSLPLQCWDSRHVTQHPAFWGSELGSSSSPSCSLLTKPSPQFLFWLSRSVSHLA